MQIPVAALYYEIRKCAHFLSGYIIAQYNTLPLFTQMEDNSNLTPRKTSLQTENVFNQI
jgi:hypothetical protein